MKGALQIDGRLAERLHLEQAERLVRIAEAIEAVAASAA
jgi:citrate lyase beta subunit